MTIWIWHYFWSFLFLQPRTIKYSGQFVAHQPAKFFGVPPYTAAVAAGYWHCLIRCGACRLIRAGQVLCRQWRHAMTSAARRCWCGPSMNCRLSTPSSWESFRIRSTVPLTIYVRTSYIAKQSYSYHSNFSYRSVDIACVYSLKYCHCGTSFLKESFHLFLLTYSYTYSYLFLLILNNMCRINCSVCRCIELFPFKLVWEG